MRVNQNPNTENEDPEQSRLMDEICLVVDQEDHRTGFDTKRNCHLMSRIKQGLLHRAFSVFLFNTQGDLLLQQRSDTKITFPGLWTNTCCSHPLNIEIELDEQDHKGVKRAAQRKLFHELGIPKIQIPLEQIHFLTKIHYLAPYNEKWGEHEIDSILVVQVDVTPMLNPEEVKNIRYVNRTEAKELISQANPILGPDENQKGIQITPWFRLISERFLFHWWEHLDQLDRVKERETIHRF